MTTRLHQMNVQYLPVEDRLLMRISTTTGDEFRIWLTRRFTGLLRKALNQVLEQSGGRQATAARDEATRMYKDGAFEKPYEPASRSYPLGEDGILAFRINLARMDGDNVKLDIAPQQGQGLSLNLNNPLLVMFSNLLEQGIEQAGWKLQTEDSVPARIH